MGILNKYVFKQVLGAVIMTVALFVFVLVVGNVMKEVISELATGRLSVSFFLYIVMLIIPGVIPYAMPLGMLTAILLIFGRMSALSEITAIKAMGKSIYSLSAPVFLIAILASIFSVGINFYYAPLADSTYKSALRNLIRNNPLQFIQPGEFIRDFTGFVIYADSQKDGELMGFRIWEMTNEKVSMAIQAQSARLTYDDVNEEILLTLNNATVERMHTDDPENLRRPIPVARSEKLPMRLSLDKTFGKANGGKKKLSVMTYGELMDARHNRHSVPEDKLTDEIRFKDRIEVQIQIQKNFAMAFSIFSMVVLAIPLGIKASRTETLANLGIALALAMTYYLSIVMISWLEKYPHCRPDLLIWLPNMVFQALGAALLYRSSKH